MSCRRGIRMSTGSEPTTAWATMRARGLTPSSFAFAADISSTAAAPSEVCDELPAWDPNEHGVGAEDGLGDDASARLDAELLRLRGRHQQHGGGAVGDLR